MASRKFKSKYASFSKDGTTKKPVKEVKRVEPKKLFTPDQRIIIINDIANWELESTKWETPEEKHREYISEITNMSDTKLKEEWKGTVGEWILSRDDISKDYTSDDLEEDFQNFIEGKNRKFKWGYTSLVI